MTSPPNDAVPPDQPAGVPTAIARLIELDEQAMAQQTRREAWQDFAPAILDALPDPLVVTDADGRIVLFNPQAELMFGYHRSEVIGQPLEKLLPARFRAAHQRDRETYSRYQLTRRASAMGGVGTSLFGLRADGHEFSADITLARLVLPEGVFILASLRFTPLPSDPAGGPRPVPPPTPDGDARQ